MCPLFFFVALIMCLASRFSLGFVMYSEADKDFWKGVYMYIGMGGSLC